MQPQYGNTFAVSLGSYIQHENLLRKLRVRFYKREGSSVIHETQIESVLCNDLFAEKIEKEMNGTYNTT